MPSSINISGGTGSKESKMTKIGDSMGKGGEENALTESGEGLSFEPRARSDHGHFNFSKSGSAANNSVAIWADWKRPARLRRRLTHPTESGKILDAQLAEFEFVRYTAKQDHTPYHSITVITGLLTRSLSGPKV